MTQGYFITGTDTGVGKTLVSTALIHALRNQGLRVSGMKPVASGCEKIKGVLCNGDADSLVEASNCDADYNLICPYRFVEPIAPHIAAKEADTEISIEHIVQCYQQLRSTTDTVVVEGVGGWQVPINDTQTMSDLAIELDLPVVIVVGGRLGCFNHALLTADSVMASGLTVAGWVFNQIDPGMQRLAAVKQSLISRMPGVLMADIPWQENPVAMKTARYFDSFDAKRDG